MESGGGGGVGGGGGGGFSYGNFHFQNYQLNQNQNQLNQNYQHGFLQPTPPLTAIGDIPQQQQQTLKSVEQNIGTLLAANGFGPFGDHGASGSYRPSGVSELINFSQGLHSNGESLNLKPQETIIKLDFGQKQVNLTHQNNPKVTRKRGKSTQVPVIKGLWSDAEDRRLRMLIGQYGDRNWAHVAEKMSGRSGKQCRERWHNHLRPDIKKDPWTEEEERILVEAHKMMKNRWTEMANLIPGRTENSIKNHWNSTKRKLNSKRYCQELEQNGYTILQKYIMSYNSRNSTDSASTIASTTPTSSGGNTNATNIVITPPNANGSENPLLPLDLFFPDDSPSMLTQESYEDELNFMQNLFDKGKAMADQMQNGNGFSVPASAQNDTSNAELESDNYLAYLSDGAVSLPSQVSQESYNNNNTFVV